MINWKTFEAKYNRFEQWAFENMSYFLFCSEWSINEGLFRYYNQAGIETEPIEKGSKCYGFQAKYSKDKIPIIDSLIKAKNKNKSLTSLVLYIGKEFSESSKKSNKKNKAQLEIEDVAKSLEVEILWRVPSHIDYQLSEPKNRWIYDIFFGNNGLDPLFFKNQVEKELSNLGPRFNEKLNFELPIARIFNSIANDKDFHRQIILKADKWVTEKGYMNLLCNEMLQEIENLLCSLQKELKDWLINFESCTVDNKITLPPIIERIRNFDKKVSDKRNELHTLKYSSKNQKENKKAYESELQRLREISNINEKLLEEFNDLNINLSNDPILIIKGEAGSGKSHLLGDIASQRKRQQLPTILLLGTSFSASVTIERNILENLDLTCSFKDFLTNLNQIGVQLNSRSIILIDAINEGGGKELWTNQISGFVKVISNYPAIGLVLTIRDTYYEDIIPDNFTRDFNITVINHQGFKGNEYEALKLFCNFYELKLPNIPILNPEFSNPLLLHLICESVKSIPGKNFPQGCNGINKLYNNYKDSLDKKLANKRAEYRYQKIASRAIEKLAVSFFECENSLTISQIVDLLNAEFPRFPNLLADLIDESILIKAIHKDRDNAKEEIVYFSYQRLGDYYIAEHLLKKYTTKEEVIIAFEKDDDIRKIIDGFEWPYHGLIEMFSIILPEKYNLELFELIEFFINREDKRNNEWFVKHKYDSFTQLLLNSLKWREIYSIEELKITNWLSEHLTHNYDNYLLTLTEIAAIPKHPFNSDRFCNILLQYSMPERDSFFQKHLLYYTGYDDSRIAFPIERLIHWAWLPNVSNTADKETSRLVAQSLTWVLSSTNNVLRDRVTKALVNLLQQQSDVLLTVMKTFQNIDDLYILERLYAIAYGCILRTESEVAIKSISQYTYDSIFLARTPIAHILLRDYALNIVEFGLYKNVGLAIDSSLIRPPFNSQMPILPKSEEEVKKYHLDYDEDDFKQTYGHSQNAIYSSVINGIADFGNYVVDSAMRHFAPVSFRQGEQYSRYLKSLKKNKRDVLKLLINSTRQKILFNKRFQYQIRLKLPWTESQKIFLEINEDILKYGNEVANTLFDSNEIMYFQNALLPYYLDEINLEDFESSPIKYWIIKRVFELGYNKKVHGEYDSSIRNLYEYDRHYNKIERIGKKYQWIAFFEILAHLTDHYKIRDYRYSSIKYDYYKGAWQLDVRNIDPAFITKNKNKDNEVSKVNEDEKKFKEWWDDDDYSRWSIPDQLWVTTLEDMVEPCTVIEKRDTTSKEWLHLKHSVDWYEPKKIGIDRYEGRRKQISYLLHAFIIDKASKEKIIDYLKNKNFWNRWLPENHDLPVEFINREKFWSPCYIDTYKYSQRIWKTIKKTKFKVMIPTEPARGGMDKDQSGANSYYNIPSKYIFEGMQLSYAQIDGTLKNEKGEVIVINSKPGSVLIQKKPLIEFLESKNLDIIWTILGEKISFDSSHHDETYFKVPCGVFYLDKEKLIGELRMFDRDI